MEEASPKQRGNAKGPTSRTVAANVRKVRQARRIDLAGLAAKLKDIGWPISIAALSRLENADRRVDVDDLMALSVALNVSPLELLLDTEELPTGMPSDVNPAEVLAWAKYETNLELDARTLYWQGHVARLRDELERMDRLAEDAEVLDKARAWAARQTLRLAGDLAAAEHRFAELSAR